ncbi:polymorphic toxin type 4 domain-containing protein [Sulfitobacter noctilucae]|uniref:polymorphic toxin type 4 domain-containing protein n=1 Tax=Sulfitobacter noctilucae TaxID=1342302 RepID=UPI0004696A42|nr:polymorphic toxin type 4 domain-containing protein [Sulfitobacter noctilucae]
MSRFKAGRGLEAFEAAIDAAPMKVTKTKGVTPDPARLRKSLKAAALVEARLRASFAIGIAANVPPAAASTVDDFRKSLTSSACAWAFWGTRGFEAYQDTRHAAELLARVGPDDTKALANVRAAYGKAMDDFKVLDAYVAENKLGAAELNSSLMFWMEHPNLTVDEIMDRMRFYLPDATPVRSRKAAPNPSSTGSIPAPDDVIKNEEHRKLLNQIFQYGDEIGGTGAFDDITCVELLGGGEKVTLSMEPLAHRMTRGSEGMLKPGQNLAPDFNTKIKPAINELEMLVDGKRLEVVNPETGELTVVILSGGKGGWNRLHLAGPGFGDEAGAGLALGPWEINHEYQNAGIEDFIRSISEQVAPHRADNLHFKLRIEMTTWGNPTPKGLTSETKEPFFRSVTYHMDLTTPEGTVSQKFMISLDNDPLDVMQGAKPNVSVTAGQDWKNSKSALFMELEKWVPVKKN